MADDPQGGATHDELIGAHPGAGAHHDRRDVLFSRFCDNLLFDAALADLDRNRYCR